MNYYSLFGDSLLDIELVIGSTIFFFFLFFIITLIQVIARRKEGLTERSWYSYIIFSQEHFLSEAFFVLGLGLSYVFFFALNRVFGVIFEWYTLLGVVSIISFLLAYFMRSLWSLLIGYSGLILWALFSMQSWVTNGISEISVICSLFLIGILLYQFGVLLFHTQMWKRFGTFTIIIGTSLIGALFLLLSFEKTLRFFPEITAGTFFFDSWRWTFLIIVILSGIAFFTFLIIKKNVHLLLELSLLCVLMVLSFVLFFIKGTKLVILSDVHYIDTLTSSGVLYAIIVNLLNFLCAAGFICIGYLRRESWIITLGTIFLFVLIVFKYFDWFFRFLDKSVFFISVGIIMVLVGFFMERGRRVLLKQIK